MNDHAITEPQSTPLTRRRLLGDTARSAAAALASSLMPPNVQRALAEKPPASSLKQIKHVVLLMQENRSFDHYFGTMAGVRGFDDPHALRLPSGKSVFHQPDALSPGGYMVPFHLNTLTTSAQKIPSTSHAWAVQHASWNDGKMDNWLPAHRKADGVNGAVRDGPLHAGRHPVSVCTGRVVHDLRRLSLFGVWTDLAEPHVLDDRNDRPRRATQRPSHSQHAAQKPSQGIHLDDLCRAARKAGVSWKVYQQKDNYGCNMLENFRVFRDAKPGSPLYERGMVRGPHDQFEQDARHDRLPAVSWIIPTGHESEHPNHMPAAGAAFVARKIDAIASNPEVWAKTLFILNYDENDGLFDHVVPPTPPRGTPGEFVHGLPIGAGFRVPCIIVSPWTAGGWVSSERFDHTSVLQFLERFTGVREPNITDWRRHTFGDLTSALRFDQHPHTPPKLPDANQLLAKVNEEVKRLPKPAPPTAARPFPAQEKRPS